MGDHFEAHFVAIVGFCLWSFLFLPGGCFVVASGVTPLGQLVVVDVLCVLCVLCLLLLG